MEAVEYLLLVTGTLWNVGNVLRFSGSGLGHDGPAEASPAAASVQLRSCMEIQQIQSDSAPADLNRLSSLPSIPTR